MGKVCSVAIICSPQAGAVTANFSQQVSGGGRGKACFQCAIWLTAEQPKWNIGVQFGCISNLDGIWPISIPPTHSTSNLDCWRHISQIQPTHTCIVCMYVYIYVCMYHSSSHKLEHMADVLKCEWKFHWNGHFHLVGIWLVQLTRWWCYITLTSNDHHIAPC